MREGGRAVGVRGGAEQVKTVCARALELHNDLDKTNLYEDKTSLLLHTHAHVHAYMTPTHAQLRW